MSHQIRVELLIDEEVLQQLKRERCRISVLADEADPDADEERAQIEAEHSGTLLDLLSDYIDNVDLPEDEQEEDLDAGTCLQCGEEFSPSYDGQQFCSDACQDAYYID